MANRSEPGPEYVIKQQFGSELSTAELYELLRLRAEVFVLEQRSIYLDVDGADLRDDTTHIWVEIGGGPVCCLRVVVEDGSRRIGRVCTAVGSRGHGLAAVLMERVLEQHGSAPLVLDAQSYIVDFYRRFGFAESGPEFLDGGIPHRQMLRPGS
jgi:ElaA protein